MTKVKKRTFARKPTGRPRIQLTAEHLTVLKALAAVGCTQDEIATGLQNAGCKMNYRTLKRRLGEDDYREIFESGRNTFKISIRRLQFRHAQMANSGGVQMTIHMSKVHLGETEKSMLELTANIHSQVEMVPPRERVASKLNALHERIQSRVAGIAADAGAQLVSREPAGSGD